MKVIDLEIRLKYNEKPVMHISEVNLTEEQKKILKKIHEQLREMEKINNSGKAHFLIALLEELTEGTFAISYIREKLTGLFGT